MLPSPVSRLQVATGSVRVYAADRSPFTVKAGRTRSATRKFDPPLAGLILTAGSEGASVDVRWAT